MLTVFFLFLSMVIRGSFTRSWEKKDHLIEKQVASIILFLKCVIFFVNFVTSCKEDITKMITKILSELWKTENKNVEYLTIGPICMCYIQSV